MEKANAIQNILIEAEENAKRARDIAQNAQGSAQKASTNANAIRLEANKTKSEALRLGNEADKLHLRVNITNSMLREHESQLARDANVTTEVIYSCFFFF